MHIVWAGVIILVCITALYLSRGNSSPYKGTRAEQFRPLTHLEIEQEKPFILKFDNEKWVYECRLAKSESIINLWLNKNAILNEFNEENKKYNLEVGLFLLRQLMLNMGEKPRGWWKRVQYNLAFHNYFRNHVEQFIECFNNFLYYQTRLFFLLRMIREMEMMQTENWQDRFSETNFDASLQERKGIPRFTSNIFLKSSTEKNNPDTMTKVQKSVSSPSNQG